ncbi:MAG: peptidase [Jaaginema sp. PMC 1079.18]|nr:peptidase [Jaaginema sp. PMC 1080.18]MEC4851918.1 peptidase [Jaaginema sp. PMC 1079.18]MEC4865545.1 peptidase [Jaaginema sp. PMC 1078.18]
MMQFFVRRCYFSVFVGIACWGSAIASASLAETLYNPIPLSSGQEVTESLTEADIPTGEGGFSRDYIVQLEEGDQVAVDLLSDEFDTIVTLIAEDGSTVGENDDGPNGTTNSLLFARITESGSYIVRVSAFGETGGGEFKVKVTRLRPVE